MLRINCSNYSNFQDSCCDGACSLITIYYNYWCILARHSPLRNDRGTAQELEVDILCEGFSPEPEHLRVSNSLAVQAVVWWAPGHVLVPSSSWAGWLFSQMRGIPEKHPKTCSLASGTSIAVNTEHIGTKNCTHTHTHIYIPLNVYAHTLSCM